MAQLITIKDNLLTAFNKLEQSELIYEEYLKQINSKKDTLINKLKQLELTEQEIYKANQVIF
jgi:tRNA/tmRNA/rRNA uracil-C5-methylase (TrmA/RlmC/RlmD family)